MIVYGTCMALCCCKYCQRYPLTIPRAFGNYSTYGTNNQTKLAHTHMHTHTHARTHTHTHTHRVIYALTTGNDIIPYTMKIL